MLNLSERQQKILEFIANFLERRNYPPTIREIGKEVGISSTSVVKYNLAKLEEHDLIDREKEVSRGLSLNWPRLWELGLLTDYQSPEPAPPALQERASSLGPNGHGRRGRADLFSVPVLGHIAAGEPIQVVPQARDTADEWLEVSRSLLSNPDNLFALRVQGDSMVDASVLDGDLVILRHQETANDGEMVAAWIEDDEETTLKYVYKEGQNVRLQPANPNYAPIIRPARKVRINGKVVTVIRHLE